MLTAVEHARPSEFHLMRRRVALLPLDLDPDEFSILQHDDVREAVHRVLGHRAETLMRRVEYRCVVVAPEKTLLQSKGVTDCALYVALARRRSRHHARHKVSGGNQPVLRSGVIRELRSV